MCPSLHLSLPLSLLLSPSPFIPPYILHSLRPSLSPFVPPSLPQQPEVTSVDQEPLLVFINGKSGGNQGVELLSAFRRHLNPHQVWDLTKGGPMPGLWSMRNVNSFRILIGGGDGTFGWVLGALQAAKDYLKCKNPPSALLPLGTGEQQQVKATVVYSSKQ